MKFRLVENLNTETLLEAQNTAELTEEEKQFFKAHRALLASNDVDNLLREYWKIENNENRLHHFYSVLIKMAGVDFLLKHMTVIPAGFFKGNTTIRDVVIPENIKYVFKEAFANSTIHKINCEDSQITEISNSCFANSSFLTDVSLPDGLYWIGNSAFSGCPISDILLPYSIQFIGMFAFYGSNIHKITMPKSVHTIMRDCFRNSCLEEVTWEKSNHDVYIEDLAFKSANEHVMKFNCFHNTSAEKYAKEHGYKIEYLD